MAWISAAVASVTGNSLSGGESRNSRVPAGNAEPLTTSELVPVSTCTLNAEIACAYAGAAAPTSTAATAKMAQTDRVRVDKVPAVMACLRA